MQISRKFPPVAHTPFSDRLHRMAVKRYGHDNLAKRLAHDAGVSPRTAEGWLSGKSPHPDTLAKIIGKWGRDALLILFSPELENHAATLQREAEEAEAKARELKAKLAALRAESPDPKS